MSHKRLLLRCRRIGIVSGLLAVVAIVAVLLGSASASAETLSTNAGENISCPHTPFPFSPNRLKGVMTRWEIAAAAPLGFNERYPSNEVRYSVTPHLSGKPLKHWVNLLESMGVNLGVLNLNPSRRIGGQLVVSPDEWTQYHDFLYLRHPDYHQQKLINRVRQFIVNYEYTPEERNQAQLDFLQRLQGLLVRGEICGKVGIPFTHVASRAGAGSLVAMI